MRSLLLLHRAALRFSSYTVAAWRNFCTGTGGSGEGGEKSHDGCEEQEERLELHQDSLEKYRGSTYAVPEISIGLVDGGANLEDKSKMFHIEQSPGHGVAERFELEQDEVKQRFSTTDGRSKNKEYSECVGNSQSRAGNLHLGHLHSDSVVENFHFEFIPVGEVVGMPSGGQECGDCFGDGNEKFEGNDVEFLGGPMTWDKEENLDTDCSDVDSSEKYEKKKFYKHIEAEADRILDILRQDGVGFNVRQSLDELQLEVSNALVREVLLRILFSIKNFNTERSAQLAYKFFAWSGQQENYRHNTAVYNLTMKIFAQCEELKAMWRLLDDMTENGLPITARTFNILICTCKRSGLAKRLVQRFIKSKTFNYRPFKHSFNAILYSLLSMNQYNLIEWVYHKMDLEGFSPDVLTYNVILKAKYMLGKLDQFHRLLEDMGKNGFAPDLHTYNLLLHVLGKGDKPLAALNLLTYMNDVGCPPSVLHFTNLIDGLSRAGNLDACEYFFDNMIKEGKKADVVCCTVMICSYLAAGEFEKAHAMFNDMQKRGLLPNVYTYNSIIFGLCEAGNFGEACSMLNDMESQGCTPNYRVYKTLVRGLRKAGKVSEANNVINHMVEKGRYLHLLSRFKGYRKCRS